MLMQDRHGRGPPPPPPPSALHPPFVRPIGFAAARPPRFHQNFVSNNPRFQPRQQHPRLHHRPPWPVGRLPDADEDAAKAIGVYQNGRTAPTPQPPFSASLTQPGVGRADGIGAFQFRMPPPPDQTPALRQRRSSSDLADSVPPSKVARQRNDDDVEDGSTPGVSFDDLVGQDELHDEEEPGGQGKDEEPHPDAWAGQAETLLSSRYCRALQLASVEPGAARIRGAAAVTAEPDAGLLGQLAGFITQQEPPVVHFYSCDYCSFCTEYDGQAAVKLTHEHLSAAGHDSASRYGRTEDGRVAVANPGQLVAPSRSRRAAESNRLAIVCPSCLLQFDSKFACGLHHLLHHGGQLACYTVLPVLASRQVSFTPAHLCKPCGREFRLADELHRHWAGGSACCPFASPVAHQRPVLVRVACPHCRLQFASLLPPAKSADKSAAREAAGAMFAARKHIVALHAERSAGSHSALLHMRATFFGLGSSLSTRTRVLAVPPLTQRSACDSLLYCIKLAKEIRAQVDRNCPSGCVLSERLRAEIAELQKVMLAAAAAAR